MGLCRKVVVVGLALVSFNANALPAVALDPRVSAMGGAGLATADGLNAVFSNPALLMAVRHAETAPLIFSFRGVDPKNVEDELGHYQSSELERALDLAITNYKADPTPASNRNALGSAASKLWAQLARCSDEAVVEEFGGGLVVPLLRKKSPVAVTVGVLSVESGQLIGLNKGIDSVERLLKAVNDGLPTTNDAYNIILSGPERNFQTKLLARGAMIYEVGLVMAREVTVGGHKTVIGVTPKYVDVTTIDDVQEITDGVFHTRDGRKRYASYNVDVGMVTGNESGWKSGFVIKNLLPQNYRTVLDNEINIGPQATVGVAKSGEWYTMAIDLDLNKRAAIGYGPDFQYLGMGAEVHLTKSSRLRLGYRYSIADNGASMVTTGAAFNVFGLETDISIGLNEDELELAAQLGFRF